MKTLTLLTLALIALTLYTVPVYSQSVLTLSPGTSLGVLSGADLCAGSIVGGGILYGGGTICGGLVSIYPTVPSNEIPQSFDMLQNYPNPFNPVTVIKYQIPQAAYISIKLYDQLGREAMTLYEGDEQAGYYHLTVDGTNLSSGIYFCKIFSSDFSKVIKMSLIK